MTFIKRPETLFVVIGTVFGLLYLICIPPFQVADEDRHYYRAFQIAEGHLISQVHEGHAGGWLPVSVAQCGASTNALRWNKDETITPQEIRVGLSVPLNLSERVFVAFRSAVYSPVAYLPAAIAFRIGIWFNAPPLWLMYIGRCANLAVWVFLIGLAIRMVPVHKWLFVILALTPMSLYQGASLSADSPTNALAFVTIAMFLSLALGRAEPISRTELFTLIVLTVLLTLTKNILFVFCLLFLLIPAGRFVTRKHYVLWFMGLTAINMAIFFLWWFAIRDIPVFWNTDVFPDQQVSYILRHPIDYLRTFVSTLRHNFFYYYSGFVGAGGWSFIYLSKWHVRLWLGTILYIALTGATPHLGLNCRQKAILLGICGVTGAMIFTLMYIYWNPVGADKIHGVQPRYFIPIAPLLLLLADNTVFPAERFKGKAAFVSLATILSLSAALIVIVHRFYGIG